jgi:uncharacterized protein
MSSDAIPMPEATVPENSEPANPVPASKAGPITSGERILYIDILRGMALFGILAANMRGFSAPADLYGNIGRLFHERADVIAQGFIDIFIQGKFVTLFSFLFGLGFAVQMSRAEARGAKFMGFYPRRLVALAIFGLIHGILIWWGDILLTYSVAGALLIIFRKRSQKIILRVALGIFVAPLLVFGGLSIAGVLGHGPFAHINNTPFDMSKISPIIATYAHGTELQIIRQNWLQWRSDGLPSTVFAIYALCLFLAGMWVYRSGIIDRLGEYKPLLKRICAICIPLGIAANIGVVYAQHHDKIARPILWGFLANALDLPAAHLLSLGYAAGLAVLIQSDAWRRGLTPFAAVGRMALTDYLTQSLVCTYFFYSYVTGFYGRMGPAVGLVATVVLYSAQILFSNWWLSKYRFGPVEWVWRGMTYGKFPAMRREPVAPIAERPIASTASEQMSGLAILAEDDTKPV